MIEVPGIRMRELLLSLLVLVGVSAPARAQSAPQAPAPTPKPAHRLSLILAAASLAPGAVALVEARQIRVLDDGKDEQRQQIRLATALAADALLLAAGGVFLWERSRAKAPSLTLAPGGAGLALSFSFGAPR